MKNPEDANHCIGCGSEIKFVSSILCPECGMKNSSDVNCCIGCGREFDNDKQVKCGRCGHIIILI